MAGNIGVNSTPKTYKSWANGYKELIDTAFKKGTQYGDGVFYKDSTENWEDRMVQIGGLDEFTRWDDGERRSQSEIKEGYAQTYTQVPFGMEVPYGRLFKKFQGKDVNIMRRATSKIGDNAYRQLERSQFSMLSYGFADSNTYLTGKVGSTVSGLLPDGKRLFSTLHPASPENSTTWSNALADNGAVGEDALQAMIENMHDQLDDKGEKKYYGDKGYIWLVPFEQFVEASRVVGSDLRAGVTDNDMNVYKGGYDGRPIEVRWVPWLSDVSTTAHFLVAKGVAEEEMPLCMLTSQPFTTDDRVDEATKTAYVGGEMIYSVGMLDGRGIVGSQGTATGSYTD